VNRTQVLVVGFLVAAWVSLVAILIVAPEIYDQSLNLPPGRNLTGEIACFLALSLFLVVLGAGVFRRWRWTFWLILVAFLAGILRVGAAAFQLNGAMPVDGPAWYVVFQGLIGLVQLAIGLAMLAGYRRAGVWGAF
jgi:hypothetical protein